MVNYSDLWWSPDVACLTVPVSHLNPQYPCVREEFLAVPSRLRHRNRFLAALTTETRWFDTYYVQVISIVAIVIGALGGSQLAIAWKSPTLSVDSVPFLVLLLNTYAFAGHGEKGDSIERTRNSNESFKFTATFISIDPKKKKTRRRSLHFQSPQKITTLSQWLMWLMNRLPTRLTT